MKRLLVLVLSFLIGLTLAVGCSGQESTSGGADANFEVMGDWATSLHIVGIPKKLLIG
ncbi:MAG: hypothetical protein MJA27_21095 [Pseudanabaenales cyanobacterium]|nr:hypothetical protein [Pseudanabaenales cyanobacterium]